MLVSCCSHGGIDDVREGNGGGFGEEGKRKEKGGRRLENRICKCVGRIGSGSFYTLGEDNLELLRLDLPLLGEGGDGLVTCGVADGPPARLRRGARLSELLLDSRGGSPLSSSFAKRCGRIVALLHFPSSIRGGTGLPVGCAL